MGRRKISRGELAHLRWVVGEQGQKFGGSLAALRAWAREKEAEWERERAQREARRLQRQRINAAWDRVEPKR